MDRSIVPSFHRSIVPSFWNARATCARATCVRVGGATRLEPRASTTRPPRVSSCRPNYVFTTTGARGFLVSARRRRELRFGELLLDPLYHAPTPFVSSEPCTNARATPARGRVFRRRPSASVRVRSPEHRRGARLPGICATEVSSHVRK